MFASLDDHDGVDKASFHDATSQLKGDVITSKQHHNNSLTATITRTNAKQHKQQTTNRTQHNNKQQAPVTVVSLVFLFVLFH